MLIACPYCGARDAQEFSYLGAGGLRRPDPSAADAADTFHAYVYLRDNPAGAHCEAWYHAAGCRRWLEVVRNTLTHEIASVRVARCEEAAP
jgi:methylglutamate dehydrogenase subunit B